MQAYWLTGEQEHIIQGPSGDLQLGYTAGEGGCGLLICHPHPQQQGTMFNKVVTTLVQAGKKCHLPVVRFNYRGVGQSAGVYGDADGEAEDALAVGQWMLKTLGCTHIVVAGFSFGASIACRIQDQLPGDLCLMVCPSVQHVPCIASGLRRCFVIQADADEVVSPIAVAAWVAEQKQTQLITIPHAGHFFHGQLIPLQHAVLSVLQAKA